MKQSNYLSVNIKKSLRYLPFTLIFTLVIGLLMAVIFSSLFAITDENAELTEKVGVGIVGDVNDKYLKPGLKAVQSIDASKNYLDLIVYDDIETAKQHLRDGIIEGYLFVPDGFISSVLRGENSKAQFVTHASPVDIGPILVNDVLSTVSSLVVESQIGIFAMEEFYFENNLKGSGKALDKINAKYISFVLMRDDLVKTVELGEKGDTTLKGYYVCGFFVIVILLMGVILSSMAIKGNMALPRLLSSRGVGAFSQTLSEMVGFAFVPVVTLFVIMLAGFFALGGKTSGIPGLFDGEFWNMALFFVKLIPAVLTLLSMQFFVYSLCGSVVAASLLQFVVSMGLAYASGCFYPTSFFPKTIKLLTGILPVGTAFDYSRFVLSSSEIWKNLALCIGYILLFAGLSCAVRRFKIRSRMS